MNYFPYSSLGFIIHVFYEDLKKTPNIVIHIHFMKCDGNKYKHLGITKKQIQIFLMEKYYNKITNV